MASIPPSHPRYRSLMTRERLIQGYRDGLVVLEGLMAYGRGEAFDYILGERTQPPAARVARVAAAHLLQARHPVLSVNGNTAVLAGEALVELSKAIPAPLEVNLFHRTEKRVERIAHHLEGLGASGVLGRNADARIPGLDSARALTSREGMFSADVALVPLEDGDRTEKLVAMGKKVLAVDLNPISRTSRMATLTIVDEVSRAIPVIHEAVNELRDRPDEQRKLMKGFDNSANLGEMLLVIRSHLEGQALG